MANNRALSKVFVPSDTTAISLGSDDIAARMATTISQQDLALQLVRNGSRGLYWLEPMLELETEAGRVAFGPVTAETFADLVAAEFWVLGEQATAHPSYLGLTEEIDFLKKQQRLTFERVGVIDPLSINDYQQQGGFEGLQKSLALSAQGIVDEVKGSGLRGRGGAAFPAGIKWQTVLDTQAEQKYIVCNADEGDSGTYADRMLMESDPFCLIEGMTIAGLAVAATCGYIYLREEYRLSQQRLEAAIAIAEQTGFLGEDVAGSGRRFSITVRLGAGAYICGEETALLESLEGKRGMVRPKPPLPAIEGLFKQPTVINNVITLASVPIILAKGGAFYQDFGMGRSRGSLPLQLAGNLKQTGLVELAFGVSLDIVLQQFGGGTRTGRPMKAVQVGGPLGAYLAEGQWQTLLDYEAFASAGAVLGHGGIVVFDDSVDMLEQARFSMEFCAIESCGKCTPCRIGSTRGVEVIDKIKAGKDRQKNLELLTDLCDTLEHGSLCAMGGMTPFPVMSAVNYFPDDFNRSDET